MTDFPIKKLQCDQRDDTTLIDDVVRRYTERARKANERLRKGNLDAPCLEEAISLGLESLELENGGPKDPYSSPIYKINVPGYFYRQHFTGEWDSDTVAGVLVSSTPDGIASEDKRYVYMSGSDGVIGHANNMFPILPGTSTYAYIVRNKRLKDRAAKREWLFVPTVFAASCNIRPSDYVSIVGGPTSTYDMTGKAQIADIKSVFQGDWKTLFKSVCGWNVADEDEKKMKFLSPAAKQRFVEDRVAWIKGLGAKLSDYGYSDTEDPA